MLKSESEGLGRKGENAIFLKNTGALCKLQGFVWFALAASAFGFVGSALGVVTHAIHTKLPA